MKECTTHHHACDCREEKFAALEKDLRLTIKQLNNIITNLKLKDHVEWMGLLNALEFYADKTIYEETKLCHRIILMDKGLLAREALK